MAKFSHEFASWGDATWKERHAKGVPVKMKFADLDAFLSTLPDRGHHALYGMSWNDLSKWGIPHAKVIGGGLQASFCNFRYKPEWIEREREIDEWNEEQRREAGLR